MTEFPEAFPKIRERVREIEFWHALSKEEEDADLPLYISATRDYRYTEFCVRLTNDDAYMFIARTPDYIKETMQEEGMKSWVETGLIVVLEVNRDSLLNAVEKWISMTDSDLTQIGILQSTLVDEDIYEDLNDGST